ncbi:MAG: hypothetical protein WCJ58_00685 [bacterium]
MRTKVEFTYTAPDFWEKVSKWESNTGWNLEQKAANSRLYQKKFLLSGPKSKIQIDHQDGKVTVAAWLESNKIIRLLGLASGSEVGVDTANKSLIDNFVGVLPKMNTRSALNTLLEKFNQEQIR